MKKCDYCGRENDDEAATCRECGSSVFAVPPKLVSAAKPCQPDGEEIAMTGMAQKDGTAITLRCRTPGEAYLVCNELAEADIVTILPDEQELQSQFRRNGYVEIRVSAKAYESVADLRSRIEFEYNRVRTKQPLSRFDKIVGVACGMLPMPGVMLLVWRLSFYRQYGYERKTKELVVCFLVGAAPWLLVLVAFRALGL